ATGDVERVQEVVGVGVIGEPRQVEGGRAAVDGAVDQHAEVDLVDGRGDADLGEEELDQFADRDGGLGAGRPDLDVEAFGVAGLGQERLGAFRVVRDAGDRRVVAGEARRDGGVGELVGAVI